MDYIQFLYMTPEITLLFVAIILFLFDLFLCGKDEVGKVYTRLDSYNFVNGYDIRTVIPIFFMAVHTMLNLYPLHENSYDTLTAFGGMYESTGMTAIVKSVLNIGVIVVFLMANKWLNGVENSVKKAEFHIVVLFTLLGMYLMISSGHFIMFFIGLELASIPMTALIAYDKKRYESAEAGAKFILLALFSSALLLYGVSLLYGVTGTLYFSQMGAALDFNLLSVMGLVLVISGLGFKISLVPFHLWTADTYEGAPTVVTGYLSVISKGAAAFVLMVILVKVFGASEFSELWNMGLFWIIIASITLANLFAIRQKNLKRFMAFSAISQAGYLVLGVMGGTHQGMTALVFYLFVYMAANLGAFAVLHVVEQNSGKIGMDDYNGLYQTNPKLAFVMTLCLFSLAGIPPFAGFFSKFFIFMAAFRAGFHLLVFIALVNTIISLYYYLLIVKAMYINSNESPIPTFESDGTSRAALTICVVGVVMLGIVSAVYEYINFYSFSY